MYFSIYQAIAEDERRPGLYREYAPDFFDLIVIDECHRGSARDESSWREILEYYEAAYQLGMTATPLRQDNRDTYKYFGDPLYTYSLRQGIDDGFLAPYRVHRVVTDFDAIGWRPNQGEVDRYGRVIPDNRGEIIEALAERGIDFEQLVEVSGQPDADPFDLLCHVAFNAPLRTRRERAQRLRSEKKDFFEKYGPEARAILNVLLDKYTEFGIAQFIVPDILEVPRQHRVALKERAKRRLVGRQRRLLTPEPRRAMLRVGLLVRPANANIRARRLTRLHDAIR